MNIGDHSLRLLVEKWFALTAATPVRVTRFSRKHASHERCVCVETVRKKGAVAIFSFSTLTVRGVCSRQKPGT